MNKQLLFTGNKKSCESLKGGLNRIAETLDGRPGFEEARRGFGDIRRLRGCLDVSPYQNVLDHAFPPKPAAGGLLHVAAALDVPIHVRR